MIKMIIMIAERQEYGVTSWGATGQFSRDSEYWARQLRHGWVLWIPYLDLTTTLLYTVWTHPNLVDTFLISMFIHSPKLSI
jgi:hypothetical protein